MRAVPAATTTSEDQAKPTLMLLDGNSLAFRAFYALPAENFKTRGGLTTGGFGYINTASVFAQPRQGTLVARFTF